MLWEVSLERLGREGRGKIQDQEEEGYEQAVLGFELDGGGLVLLPHILDRRLPGCAILLLCHYSERRELVQGMLICVCML